MLNRASRYVSWALGAACAVATLLALGRESGNGTYAGASGQLLWLQVVASAALLLAGSLRGAATIAWVGSLWLVPEWAGLSAFSPATRTVADSLPCLLAGLLVGAVGSAGSSGWSRLARAAVGGGLVAVLARLFLVDPFQDARCWRFCDHNPLTTAQATELGLVIGQAGAAVVLAAALSGAVAAGREPGVDRFLCCLLAALLAGLALLRPAIPESASSFGYVVALVAAQGLAIALGLVALRREVRAWQLTLRLGALARSLTALRGGSVEAALRRALHDPGLTLSYWSADLGGYVDRDGRPVERLRTDPFVQSRAGRRTTSVTRRDRPVALLVHGPKVDGQRVARALGAGVRLALENEQLRAAATATLRDLEESRGRILERAMAERHRLERNLHDGTQQRLVSLALLVRMLRNHVSDQADVAVSVRAEALVLETLEELRRIARGLYPAALADGGLSVALHDLAESSTDVAVQVDRAPQRRYHGTVETTAYLVSAAAIADARARAASRLTIRATESTGRLVLDLEDDAASDRVNGADACSGLADQVAALAGRIATRRTASGVHVRLEVPCAR